MTLPSCSGGSCKQGRARCETPFACELPDELSAPSGAIVKALVIALCLLALIAAVLPALFY